MSLLDAGHGRAHFLRHFLDLGQGRSDLRLVVEAGLQQSSRLARISSQADTTSAYRVQPVPPADQLLQTLQMDGQYWIDHCTMFGSRAAGFYCCVLGDLLCWILVNVAKVPNAFHYVDNFFQLPWYLPEPSAVLD
ncbi:hypothetical protein HDU86_000908 [Geranomyces michiganensis]|nr:hypothetical protein HDU86_000908 [Geranomyces michiganensis]